jgi:Fe-S cluster biogenesis protein NfuA
MIPMHAVATANPQQLRWVIAAGNLPGDGAVRCAPGRLGALLDDGVIEKIAVCGSEVVITLADGGSWRTCGDQIRDALGDALLDPAGWRVDAAERTDEVARVAAELLAGPIGALAASHGGSIELAAVADDQVTVRMAGACHGCPASRSTLYDKLQRELRRRVGDQVTVCVENSSAALSFGKKLLTLVVR